MKVKSIFLIFHIIRIDRAIVIIKEHNLSELCVLIRHLCFSKEASELLASRLNDLNLLDNGTKITFYRTRKKHLLSFFSHESKLVFYQDVRGLLIKMGLPEYLPYDWWLFIDSFKKVRYVYYYTMKTNMGQSPIAHYQNERGVWHSFGYG